MALASFPLFPPQESLFANAVPSGTPTDVHGFTAKILASGPGRASPQTRLPVAVKFYHFERHYGDATPYVGIIDLHDGLSDVKPAGHFRVPRRGHVQVRRGQAWCAWLVAVSAGSILRAFFP